MVLKNEKGVVLFVVLLIMTVVMILGTAFLYAMRTEGIQVIRYEQKTQAYYYARSGAEAALEWLDLETFLDPAGYNGVAYLEGSLSGLTASQEVSPASHPIKVKISKITGEESLLIEATGKDHTSVQQVSVVINYTDTGISLPSFDVALFAAGSGGSEGPAIQLNNGPTITGHVGTNAYYPNSIQLGGGARIEGDVSIGPSGDVNEVFQLAYGNLSTFLTGAAGHLPEAIIYPSPVFPDFPEGLPAKGHYQTDTGVLSGTVRTSDGQGLGNVQLYIYPAKDGAAPASMVTTVDNIWWPAGHGTWHAYVGEPKNNPTDPKQQIGTVIIKPAKAGYRFEPAEVQVTGPLSNLNFLAIPDSSIGEPGMILNPNQDLFWKIDEDGYYETINVVSNRMLVIDLKGGTRVLRVKNMNIAGKIQLMNVGETGKLLLYIENSFRPASGSLVNYIEGSETDPNDLFIFLKGTTPLPANQYKLAGNIMLEQGDATISQGVVFNGNLISGGGKVTLSGGSTVANGIVYAPNSQVSVLEGAKLRGSIISYTLYATGGIHIIYDPSVAEDFPYEILDLGEDPSGGNPTLDLESLQWR